MYMEAVIPKNKLCFFINLDSKQYIPTEIKKEYPIISGCPLKEIVAPSTIIPTAKGVVINIKINGTCINGLLNNLYAKSNPKIKKIPSNR